MSEELKYRVRALISMDDDHQIRSGQVTPGDLVDCGHCTLHQVTGWVQQENGQRGWGAEVGPPWCQTLATPLTAAVIGNKRQARLTLHVGL